MPAWIRGLIWISGRDIQRDTIQVMLDASYLDVYRWLYPDDKGYTFPTWDHTCASITSSYLLALQIAWRLAAWSKI
jgi:hypothetical protein